MLDTLQKFEIVVIGAGPAGLSFAREYTRTLKPENILIIDSGSEIDRRNCSLVDCKNCLRECKIISGFGGSLIHGDSIKLSFPPSGRKMIELIGQQNYKICITKIKKDFNNLNYTLRIPRYKNTKTIYFKNYPVAFCDKEDVMKAIRELYKTLSANSMISIELNCKVINIERENDIFHLTLLSKNREYKISSNKLIIATGRAGYEWFNDMTLKIGIKHKQPKNHVGIRVECPIQYINKVAERHPDFRAYSTIENTKYKTFCFNAGANGGRIKSVRYGTDVFIDGAIVCKEEYEDSGNFAIIYSNKLNEQLIKDYCKLGKSKPILQWYPDFKDNTLNCQSKKKIVTILQFKPSIQYYSIGKLSDIFDDETRRSLCEFLEDIFSYFLQEFHSDSGITLHDMLKRISIVGIEIENFWNIIEVNLKLESSIKNLYVIGDSLGKSQGIIPAMVSGYHLANIIN